MVLMQKKRWPGFKVLPKGAQRSSEITTTIFGAPSDPAILEGYRQAGVDRAIIMLRSESSDVVRKRLETIAAELSGHFL